MKKSSEFEPPLVKPGSIVEFLLDGNTLYIPPSEVGLDCHQDFQILSPQQIEKIPPLAKASILLSFPYQLVAILWPHDKTLIVTVAPHTACPPPLWYIFDCYFEARRRATKQ